MKLFVKNSNSLGNIDYNIPVTDKQNDYRTTYTKYNQYLPPTKHIEIYGDNPIFPQRSLHRDINAANQYYQTSYNTSWVNKYNRPSAGEVFKRPGKFTNMNYLSRIEEKMFKEPTPPMKQILSETHDEYNIKERVPEYLFTPKPRLSCPLNSLGGDEQDRIKIETNTGLFKLLDPYVTCTRLTHIPFTKDQIAFSNANKISTYYSAQKEPKQCTPKVPVYDSVKFSKPIRERMIPGKKCVVPHVGFSTEYKSSYHSPKDSELSLYIFYNGVDYPLALSPDMKQNLCAPGMYCTEQCHIGTGWPPGAVVKQIPPHYRKPHEPCYSRIN